jgi:ribose-phosphate pyrophosphokinase
MKPLLLPMPGNEVITGRIAHIAVADVSGIECRRFPDGESYLRIAHDVSGRAVAIVDSLFDPDRKTLPLLFAAEAVRDLGAASVGLVAPYLGYMRQDARFKPGEALTSSSYGKLLSQNFDWLATVDPHLHRHTSLSEIYSIPSIACQAAPKIAEWVGKNVERPLLVGPDSESRQWVSQIAGLAGCPFVTLKKTRLADRKVKIELPDLSGWRDRTPVIADDIISTGTTMETAIQLLCANGFSMPYVMAVHGLFVGDAEQRLSAAGATQIVSTNTIPQSAGTIDVSSLLADAIAKLATSCPSRI